MEGCVCFIGGMRIAQNAIWAVPCVCDSEFRGIWKISGRTGGEKVVPAFSDKMRGGFSCIWRAEPWEMRTVIAAKTGIVVCQVGADQLRMYALKVIVRFSIVCDSKIKITGAHAKRQKTFLYFRIRAKKPIRSQDGTALCAVCEHDLEPADIFPCAGIMKDMRAIHAAAWVQRRGWIIRLRRNNQSKIFPVIKIIRNVTADAPMLYPVFTGRFLLVFAVPVIPAVFI